MTRKILFDPPLPGMHSSFWEIVNYPPEGYEFLMPNGPWDRLFDRLIRNELLSANLALASFLNRLFPPRLLKAWLDRMLRGAVKRDEVDLIFSMDHIVLEKKPWVILITWANGLTGLHVKHLKTYRRFIEEYLASGFCRKIITWSELAKTSILANFDGNSLAQKMAVVPLAFHRQDFVKSHNEDRVKLLFVGTANSPRGRVAALLGTKYLFDFLGKGGNVVLRAFCILSQRYPNLELVVRSGVPAAVRQEFENHSNIRFLEKIIPREELVEEFKSADIFLYPTHQLTPWTVFLEAMSYELPIVTTNLYANPEIVQDRVTGLLIQPSKKVPYYWENFLLPMGSPVHREYLAATRTPDSAVVEELVEKTSFLIENPEVRLDMGRRARWEVEKGRHSIVRRNQAFKQIFDSALVSS